MCGIAIIGSHKDNEKKIRMALSKIIHRGDHPYEYLVFEGAALGANRLAIVDEESGRQPKANEDKTIFATQNGEIFNHHELADKLRSLGHLLTTENDTEVLVHLWEEYKEKMLQEIDSEMFAFVVYDKKNNEVFAARDPIGVKPFYYAFCDNDNFYLASEIKALVDLPGIKDVHEFPPGHYFFKGEFHKYFELPVSENKISEDEAISTLSQLIEEAVRKRVQTKLPIAVFLSGGVDSSLIMELATRFHPNVTALILGYEDSPDYKAAVGICEEKGWQYRVVKPEIDYEKELEGIIYHLETYDPNIVRHSFANDLISKFAHDLGYKVILTGEGADEIFAGYNEFLSLDRSKINLGCKMLLDSMSKGNLMRIDKMAMRHTIETRCPFFDSKIVQYAMSVPGSLKIGKYKEKDFTKLILRQIASLYLPENIAFREKVPFANGAGMNIGMNYTKADGVLSEIAEKLLSDKEFERIQNENPVYKIKTKEEALFLSKYLEFGYGKFVEGRERLIVKDVLFTI